MSKSLKNIGRVKNKRNKKYTRRKKKCIYTDEAKRIIKEINALRKYNKSKKINKSNK